MLKNKIALYVPTTIHSKPAPDLVIHNYLVAAKKTFAQLFGGFTVVESKGGWFSETEGLIEEKIFIVYSFAENLDKVNEIELLAQNIASGMMQEAVSVEVNNELRFIEQNTAVAA